MDYSDIYGKNNVTILFYDDDEKEFIDAKMSDGGATRPGLIF